MKAYRTILLGAVALVGISCRTVPESGLSELQSGSSSEVCDQTVERLAERAKVGDPIAMSILDVMGINGLEAPAAMIGLPATARALGMSETTNATEFSNAVAGGQGKEFDPQRLEEIHNLFVAGKVKYKCCWTEATTGEGIDIKEVYGLLKQDVIKLSQNNPAEVLQYVGRFQELFENHDPTISVGALEAIYEGVLEAMQAGNAHADMQKVQGPLLVARAEALMQEFLIGGAQNEAQAQLIWETLQNGMKLNRGNEVGDGVRGIDNLVLNKWYQILKNRPAFETLAGVVRGVERDLNAGGVNNITETQTDAAGMVAGLAAEARVAADIRQLETMVADVRAKFQELAQIDNSYQAAAAAWAGAKIVPVNSPKLGQPKFRIVSQGAGSAATASAQSATRLNVVELGLIPEVPRSVAAAQVNVKVAVPAAVPRAR